jgi:pheromone shutdown protein TraB
VTSKRLYRTIRPMDIIKFVQSIFSDLSMIWLVAKSHVSKSPLSESDTEKLRELLKKVECVSPSMLQQIAKLPPAFRKCFLDERNEYMASVLRDCQGKRIVGVFGAAHIDGIAQHVNDHHIDGRTLRKQLTVVPPHNFYSLILYPATVVVFLVGLTRVAVFGLRRTWRFCRFVIIRLSRKIN